MNTRSMTRILEETNAEKIKYEVTIDFDQASEAWKANKTSIGNGSYKYVCQAYVKSGNKCKRKPLVGCHFCSQHNI